MCRLLWIALIMTLLVACTSPISEEPQTTPLLPPATSEPTQTNVPESADTPAAAQAEADETPDPTVEPAEQIEPHELTSEELQALSEGTRFNWTSGAIDSDEFGNTYTIVTDIPNYHIRGIDADLLKQELNYLGVYLPTGPVRFDIRNLQNFEDNPQDARNITNWTETPADPDEATGSISTENGITVITCYYSSDRLEQFVDERNIGKDNEVSYGYRAYEGIGATLYMQLPEKRGQSAPFSDIVDEMLERLPKQPDGRWYVPSAIDAYWDDQSS